MIDIKHKETGEVLLVVEADTLKGANLFETDLYFADLRDVCLSGAGAALVNASYANLSGANLMSVSFYSGHLEHTDLHGANLIDSNLEGTNLQHADLHKTKMYGATLRHTVLMEAILRGAEMKLVCLAHANACNADFRDTDLTEAVFQRTILTGVNFTGARLEGTVFAQCPTLSKAVGLTDVEHRGPSSLDQQTLRACVHDLPEAFLEGVGFSAQEIKALRQMYPRV